MGESAHIFYSQRALDVRNGLPKWSKYKDGSELIPETLEKGTKKKDEASDIERAPGGS